MSSAQYLQNSRYLVLKKLGDIKKIVGEYDACLKHWNDALLLWKQEWEAMNPRRWDVYDYGRFLCEYARVYLDRDDKGERKSLQPS